MTQTTPQDLAAQIEALEKYIADYEDAPNWGGPTMYPAPPSVQTLRAIVAAIRQGEGLRAAWQRVSDELDHIPNGMHADLEDAASALWDFFPDGAAVKGTGQYIDECVECVGTGCSATEKPCTVCKGSGIKPGSVWRSTMAPPPAPDERDDEVRVTLAAGAIIDIMTGGNFDWRSRLDESDFLESADWMTAVAYARAVLSPAKGGEA